MLLTSVLNTATRRLTTVNYNLLIYEDKSVVSRGISWRTAGKDVIAAGSLTEAARVRIERASVISEADLLSDDRGNRIVRRGDIDTARLGRRLMLAHLEITLKTGAQLTYKWVDAASQGNCDDIQAALLVLLGGKLS